MKIVYVGLLLFTLEFAACQEYGSTLAGQNYILRSCISSVELIRTHRKTLKNEKMLSSNAVAEPTEVKPRFSAPKQANDRRRRPEETPLRTLSIRRSAKSRQPPSFTRKTSFPELPAPQNHQQKRQRESQVIVIRSTT